MLKSATASYFERVELMLGRSVVVALFAVVPLLSGCLPPPPKYAAVRSANSTSSNSDELPPTVEAYWQGDAACLAEASDIDAVAETSLRILCRYSPPVNRTVHGIRLRQQPKILVDALVALPRKLPTGSKLAGTYCESVECVARANFGDPQGLWLLHLLVRYRYNASHLAEVDAVAASPEELRDLLLAAGDFPASVLPMRDADERPIVIDGSDKHTDRGGFAFSSVVLAISGAPKDVGIRAQSEWTRLAPHTRRAVIFHELSHDWLRNQRRYLDADAVWRRAMVTDSVFQKNTGRPFSVVSAYAEANLDEDFAQSATAYRYTPELLIQRAPNRARLLKDWMFDGLSYG